MKFIKLLTSAYVGGVLRHPHEGVLHIEDADAQRLLDDEAATDVSDDFTAKQDREMAGETISAASPTDEAARGPAPAPHQSEVAPQATEDTKQAARKAAASKE